MKAAVLAAAREATDVVVAAPLCVVDIKGRCRGDLDRVEDAGELLPMELSLNGTYCGIMRGGVAVPLGVSGAVSKLARS